MKIPASLNWLANVPEGANWLNTLPRLVEDVVTHWRLTITGRPFAGGSASYVIPVSRHDEAFVLKVQWPHHEATFEAQALKAWNGNGAIKLVDHDPARHALLLERCSPGTFLADSSEDDPLAVLIDLLPRLWIETDLHFQTLADEAKSWAQAIPTEWEEHGRPCERNLIDEALAYIDRLAENQPVQVLVHQDLHGHNILSAEREPWLAIDPKPLLGEREFSLAPIVRSAEFGATAKEVVGRLDRLCAILDLDRDRALGWTVAQTMAWGFGGAGDDYHYQISRWLISAK